MKFTKMQGLGNDYIYINAFEEQIDDPPALVAASLCGMTGREAEIELDGGVLHDRWDDRTGHVFMTGPAAFVFDGEYEA